MREIETKMHMKVLHCIYLHLLWFFITFSYILHLLTNSLNNTIQKASLELRKDRLRLGDSDLGRGVLDRDVRDFAAVGDEHVALSLITISLISLILEKGCIGGRGGETYLGARRAEEGGGVEEEPERGGEFALVVCDEVDRCVVWLCEYGEERRGRRGGVRTGFFPFG